MEKSHESVRSLNTLKWTLISFIKNKENLSFFYPPSYCFKPVWLTLICRAHKNIFEKCLCFLSIQLKFFIFVLDPISFIIWEKNGWYILQNILCCTDNNSTIITLTTVMIHYTCIRECQIGLEWHEQILNGRTILLKNVIYNTFCDHH